LNTLRTVMPSEKDPQAERDAARSQAKRLVAHELGRVVGAGLMLPWRALTQALKNKRLRSDFLLDLKSEPTLAPEQSELTLPERPLRIFICCAEASGENHALRLVRALRDALEESGAPPPEIFGLGGPRFKAEGVQTIGDPVSNARMGFAGVIEALPFYLGLLTASAQEFLAGDLDLFVGVDSPALNVPLAHMAKSCGLTTVQYITPQYWGWAPWRVNGFREAFDHGLSILPFEPAWFARHGVCAQHVGHPQLDAMQVLEPKAREANARRQLVILPGSRRSVIERNLPTMLECLGSALGQNGEWSARILQSNDAHKDLIESCMSRSGFALENLSLSLDLENELASADAALSVSGTILTHLLFHRVPCVVLYRLESSFQEWIGRNFLTVPYFSSVNLLAGSEVYPEHGFAQDSPTADYRACVDQLLTDSDWRAKCSDNLEAAARRLGPPGASHRAANACLAAIPDQARTQGS
jgi:lipid-A-disaccharide synthase